MKRKRRVAKRRSGLKRRAKLKRVVHLPKHPGKRAYDLGHRAGNLAGYLSGYNAGLTTGKEALLSPFEGISIIIPTFNQGELLRECIESICAYTPEPHEIIVIDNASTDGTANYLRTMSGKLRYRINTENMGFAGGVNQGLKMARGNRLLLLNNDTIVTKHWLANLSRCLESEDRIGLAGPMTNYISGEQLVAATYSNIQEMHQFAEAFNQSNPDKWRKTERITGFCLLFKRELLERLGFFDEGFDIGNCEDDDFCLRVRLLGLELVIAGDVFIHHVGSVSMKALGSEMGEVYGRNLAYFSKKWGNVDQLMSEMAGRNIDAGPRRMVDFYPDQAVVKGTDGSKYMLQSGKRRRLVGAEGYSGPMVRLSNYELRQCGIGADIDIHELHSYRSTIGAHGGQLQEGTLCKLKDGQVGSYEAGKLRRIVSELALTVWGYDNQVPLEWDETSFAGIPLGLPIIAPIGIKAENL